MNNSRRFYIQKGLNEAQELMETVTEQQAFHIEQISNVLIGCLKARGKILVCGNGGSACDAMHFAEELTGRFRKNRRALPAIALTDAAHMSCVGNDFGFEFIFSRAVEALGRAGDVLLAISTSGNSENVSLAVEQANGCGMQTVCLLGKDGGKLKGKCDAELVVPSISTDRIQETHILVLHLLVEAIERELFPENYV